MVEHLFEALFGVSFLGLVSALVVGLVFLAWPRMKIARRIVGMAQIRAHV
jgi:hypothetical protein